MDPEIGEILRLETELENSQDRKAVAVKKNGQSVGHVPKSFSSAIFFYLTRSCKL